MASVGLEPAVWAGCALAHPCMLDPRAGRSLEASSVSAPAVWFPGLALSLMALSVRVCFSAELFAQMIPLRAPATTPRTLVTQSPLDSEPCVGPLCFQCRAQSSGQVLDMDEWMNNK